jgi:hypothetical protein
MGIALIVPSPKYEGLGKERMCAEEHLMIKVPRPIGCPCMGISTLGSFSFCLGRTYIYIIK